MIILILGLPGSGKTYFAKALSEYTKIGHVNTDLIRNDMKKRGQYSESSKEEVYKQLLNRVEEALRKSHSIIVDATFSKKGRRELFKNLAKIFNTSIGFVEIVAEESCIKERLKKPRVDSQADFNVYKKLKAEFEPIEQNRLILHSDKMSIDEMIQNAMIFLDINSNDG